MCCGVNTPPNSVELHLFIPEDKIFIVEREDLNEFYSDWQYHLYKYGCESDKTTFQPDKLNDLFSMLLN